MPAKLTTLEYINKCNIIHKGRWDYSNLEYTGSKNKVKIICIDHGEFLQTASDHLGGCGCPNCDKTKKLTSDEFIKRSIIKHNNKYDYSKVNYGNNNYDLVKIICKDHGEFLQRPWAHLRGQGCPKCCKNTIMSNKDFIEKCILIHGNIYDYSITNYIGRRKNISIICKEHGLFEQEARVHLEGFGCKRCNTSRLEKYLLSNLNSIKEPFEYNKKFKTCKNKNMLPFDFYLPLRNILVECDGIQHQEPVEYFGGQNRFLYQKNNDNIKTKWCHENQIRLIRLKSNSDIDNLINELNNSKILFDKSNLKDILTDRDFIKNDDKYLIKTDFNYYSKSVQSEISNFIKELNVNFKENVKYNDININWIVDKNYFLLIDNFRDCEINRSKNWLFNLKNELELIGVNIVVIYPEDWIYKKDIVKSRIKNLLKLNKIKIGSRDCEIIIPDNKSVMKFLNDNHIQGFINSSIKIALSYNGEIVSIMTFGKLRRSLGQKVRQEDSYELLRFCNKINYTVIGSGNKLMNFFIKNYAPKYILSYADRCWTSLNNNIYCKIGMSFCKKTLPSYSYLVGDKKYDRFKYRKDKLVGLGYKKDKWTERMICSSNLVFRIYDTGCLKYEINF